MAPRASNNRNFMGLTPVVPDKGAATASRPRTNFETSRVCTPCLAKMPVAQSAQEPGSREAAQKVQ